MATLRRPMWSHPAAGPTHVRPTHRYAASATSCLFLFTAMSTRSRPRDEYYTVARPTPRGPEMANNIPKQSADAPTTVPPPLPSARDNATPSEPAHDPAVPAKPEPHPPSPDPERQPERGRTLLPQHFFLLLTHLASRLGFRGAVASLAILPLLFLVVYETFAPGRQVEVQPIEAPSQHIDAGYAPHVLALHLIDEIRRIRSATQTTTMHHTDTVIAESTSSRGGAPPVFLDTD